MGAPYTGLEGRQASLLAQVGGFYRRQNSGYPLFSVRVRSRRESRWGHQILGKHFCACLGFFWCHIYGTRGEASKHACAGRRALPPTKQWISTVFRARPLKARVPMGSPNKLKANPFPLGDGFAFIVFFGTYKKRRAPGVAPAAAYNRLTKEFYKMYNLIAAFG